MAFDISDFLQIKFPIQCYNKAFRKLSTWKPSWGKQRLNEYVWGKNFPLWETHDKSFSVWIFGIFVIYFPRKERGMRLQMHFVKKAETSLIGSKTIFQFSFGEKVFPLCVGKVCLLALAHLSPIKSGKSFSSKTEKSILETRPPTITSTGRL